MTLIERHKGKVRLNLHAGQRRAWHSRARWLFILAGTQSGKTSFLPWLLWREIHQHGAGDYLAVAPTFDLFKLKLLPEMRHVFERILNMGRYWAGNNLIELRNPETGQFEASDANGAMWGRIIMRSATAEGGLESATAKAAILDECGQDAFKLSAFQAIQRRVALNQGRIIGATTLYNLGWVKQHVYDPWQRGATHIDVVQFDSVMNPCFSAKEFEDARQRLPLWKFNMFYRGIYARPAGMIYADFIDKYADEGGHKVKPFKLPSTWPSWVGVDPGAVHCATIWLAHDVEKNVYYLYHESLEGGKSTPEHARTAAKVAQHENVVVWAVGQKSEVQQRLDWAAEGLHNVVAPPFHDVESGIDRVIRLLREHRLRIFDSCEGILDEMGRYSRVLDEDGQPTAEIEDKAKFHRLDALRYAVAQLGIEPPHMDVVDNPFWT